MPINNNPFTYKGRIHRLPYAIYIIILRIIILLCALAIRNFSIALVAQFRGDYGFFLALATVLLICGVVLTFFNTIKRLRDVKQSPWWSLVIFLGPLYIILFIYLVIVQSKWPDGNEAPATPLTPGSPATTPTLAKSSAQVTPATSATPGTSTTSTVSENTTPSVAPATPKAVIPATPTAPEAPTTPSKPTTPTA